jgi:hypothetical protein
MRKPKPPPPRLTDDENKDILDGDNPFHTDMGFLIYPASWRMPYLISLLCLQQLLQ